MTIDLPKYKTTDEVDFVVIGSGAAGGIVAKELSENGFRVVVLEQGPYLTEKDFIHDEIEVLSRDLLTNHPDLQPNTFRKTPDEKAKPQRAIAYGRLVGGTSMHFTANFWRFHEIDFKERSKVGAISGSTLTDWPITYADLEPYYTKVEWEIGVSGLAGASPFDPPRSKPYPMPPLPVKSCGVIFERAARKLGWNPFPAPMAILSQPRRRAQRVHQLRLLSRVRLRSRREIQLASRRHSRGGKNRPLRNPPEFLRSPHRDGCQRPRHRRRLFRRAAQRPAPESESRCRLREWRGDSAPAFALREQTISRRPRQLQRHRRQKFNVQQRRAFRRRFRASSQRLQGICCQPHPPRFLRARSDKVGFYGGGGLDARFDMTPISFALGGLPPGTPRWGKGFKDVLSNNFTRTVEILCHGTSLPVENNSFSLDPDLKDAWGLPALRMTYKDHPDDVKLSNWLNARAAELLQAAGAQKQWSYPAGRTGILRPPARHLPHGQRPKNFRHQFRPSNARRKKSFPLRRQQPGHQWPRPAHHDHRSARFPRLRPHHRSRQTRRPLRLSRV